MQITVSRNQGALVFSVLSTSFDIVFSSDSVVALTKSCKWCKISSAIRTNLNSSLLICLGVPDRGGLIK